MRNILGNLLFRLRQLMQGGYGNDGLTMPLVVLSCVVTLISSLSHLWWLRLLGSAILLWAIFRMFSKNHIARRKELQIYFNLKQKITGFSDNLKTEYQNHKTRKYFKCPNCKGRLFVPRGKGKIQITCRKCGHKFIKRT